MWLVWESPWGWGAPHRGVSGSLCKPVLPPLDWLINSTVSTHWHSVSSCWEVLGHRETRQSRHCSRGMAVHTKSTAGYCASACDDGWEREQQRTAELGSTCLDDLCPHTPAYPTYGVWWCPPRLSCLQVPLLSVLLADHADALLVWGQSLWMSMHVGKSSHPLA